ncbi:MAG TPA: MFS transporter [Gaiellaceae bacterium]|nr:MFS transporter [Gaiellaceae bacterium]
MTNPSRSPRAGVSRGRWASPRRDRLRLPQEGDTLSELRSLLLALALPTLALAFAISVLTTYGPVVLIHLAHSDTKVGLLIGGEGVFALCVPLLAGAASDRLPASRLGRRLPFVLLGTPFLAAGLVLLPFSPSYLLAALVVFAIYVGYFLYYPPYRALYADLFPRSYYGRAQSSQALARGAGLGAALLAGGLLLTVWRPFPFALAAAVVLAATLALLPVARLASTVRAKAPDEGLPRLRELVRNRDLAAFAVANALWEFSFTGLRTFVVLYVVQGLGESAAVASGVIAVVAVAYVVAAPLAGWLGDRYGIVTVIRWSGLLYGVGLVCGVFPHSLAPMLPALPVVALAGAVLMTLPQALGFSLAPAGSEGAVAGIQDFSRGLGVVLGPIVVGAAIDLFRGDLASTSGYAAMWPTIGIPVLAGVAVVGLVGRPPDDAKSALGSAPPACGTATPHEPTEWSGTLL